MRHSRNNCLIQKSATGLLVKDSRNVDIERSTFKENGVALAMTDSHFKLNFNMILNSGTNSISLAGTSKAQISNNTILNSRRIDYGLKFIDQPEAYFYNNIIMGHKNWINLNLNASAEPVQVQASNVDFQKLSEWAAVPYKLAQGRPLNFDGAPDYSHPNYVGPPIGSESFPPAYWDFPSDERQAFSAVAGLSPREYITLCEAGQDPEAMRRRQEVMDRLEAQNRKQRGKKHEASEHKAAGEISRGLRFEYNDIYDNEGPDLSGISKTNFSIDPMFEDPFEGNYQLRMDSPLLHKGSGGTYVGALPAKEATIGEGEFR